MGKTHSRSRSHSRSHSKSKSQKVGQLSSVDFSKNLYYTKGNSIVQKSRMSNKKKVVGKFEREPGFLYYVNG